MPNLATHDEGGGECRPRVLAAAVVKSDAGREKLLTALRDPPGSASGAIREPEPRMSISRYIVVAVVRCSLRLLALARAPVELAEAEVAVGDERAHAARLGERQRLAVVGLAALGIEPVGMGRDVAEQVQRIGPRNRC